MQVNAQERPNIIWIYAEDTSPWMGCYGDEINKNATPNINRIAAKGVQFNHAFVPAPVCSATRSAMMLGQSAIRFDAHEHRSSRTVATRKYLPEEQKMLPQIMNENGYTTFNHGKGDYNFFMDYKKVYTYRAKSKTDFSALIDKQPFFGQIQTKGGKNNTSKFPAAQKVSPSDVTVPADYPNNEVFKKWVAQHYDAIRMDDALIGRIVSGLKEAGLDKNTIVVYFSDHGANNLLRHKQMTTEGGLHVPFVVMGPDTYLKFKENIRNDLVSMLDLSATTLSWAGIEIPAWYEGQDLFGNDFKERTYVGGHKDRLDHTIDRVRSIRTENFRYVKNYKLDRVFLQPQYRDKEEYTQNLHQLYKEGRLSQVHKDIYFGERPAEELYHIVEDPEMIHNLATDPRYKKELENHRVLLKEWLAKGDEGIAEESIAELKDNGEDKPWGEGVNAAYEMYRKDTDGDGLSDKWELLNGRNPEDGLFSFSFDCGGWQTEGWYSDDISDNIAGYQGYLDFSMDTNLGTLKRDGLQLKANTTDHAFVILMKATQKVTVVFSANGKVVGRQKIKASHDFEATKIKLNKKWNGTIERVSIQFSGAANTFIEIDNIRIEPK